MITDVYLQHWVLVHLSFLHILLEILLFQKYYLFIFIVLSLSFWVDVNKWETCKSSWCFSAFGSSCSPNLTLLRHPSFPHTLHRPSTEAGFTFCSHFPAQPHQISEAFSPGLVRWNICHSFSPLRDQTGRIKNTLVCGTPALLSDH